MEKNSIQVSLMMPQGLVSCENFQSLEQVEDYARKKTGCRGYVVKDNEKTTVYSFGRKVSKEEAIQQFREYPKMLAYLRSCKAKFFVLYEKAKQLTLLPANVVFVE